MVFEGFITVHDLPVTEALQNYQKRKIIVDFVDFEVELIRKETFLDLHLQCFETFLNRHFEQKVKILEFARIEVQLVLETLVQGVSDLNFDSVAIE